MKTPHQTAVPSSDLLARQPVVESPIAPSPRSENGKRHKLDPETLLRVLARARDGDFSARLPEEWTDISGRIADVFNEMMQANNRMA